MLAQWIADVVGQMHKHRISKGRLAQHLGLTREYVSLVLNGHRDPPGVEDKFRKAVDEIVASLSMDEEYYPQADQPQALDGCGAVRVRSDHRFWR